jgi:alpha-glucosidase (family GH31 glycosyl hydrolase)
MPPLWSLGNQQCRYSYETADELREIARNFRERDIPCDTLYLDIDYMDGYRVFTWDKERFPEPEKLTAELREGGFNLVTIVDPGVKVDETTRSTRKVVRRTSTARRARARSSTTSCGRGSARSRTSRTQRRGSGGARTTGRSSTRGWPGSGAT